MEKLAVKVPENQKKDLDRIAEKEGYPNKSEFLREMIRNEIKKRKKLKKEVLEELEQRKKELEEGELELEDLVSNEELKEEIESK